MTALDVLRLEALKSRPAAQIEIARGLTDNESIGDIICKRAETLNALAVVRS